MLNVYTICVLSSASLPWPLSLSAASFSSTAALAGDSTAGEDAPSLAAAASDVGETTPESELSRRDEECLRSSTPV